MEQRSCCSSCSIHPACTPRKQWSHLSILVGMPRADSCAREQVPARSSSHAAASWSDIGSSWGAGMRAVLAASWPSAPPKVCPACRTRMKTLSGMSISLWNRSLDLLNVDSGKTLHQKRVHTATVRGEHCYSSCHVQVHLLVKVSLLVTNTTYALGTRVAAACLTHLLLRLLVPQHCSQPGMNTLQARHSTAQHSTAHITGHSRAAGASTVYRHSSPPLTTPRHDCNLATSHQLRPSHHAPPQVTTPSHTADHSRSAPHQPNPLAQPTCRSASALCLSQYAAL